MEEKTTAPKCFLVNHGAFYGREITNGMIFVPGRDEKANELIATVHPGDLFFHLSPSGISALGRATSMPLCVPFPSWRSRESRPGERGIAVQTEVFLLPMPVPVKQAELPYLTALSGAQAKSLFAKISEHLPGIAAAGWIKTVCFDPGF